MSPAPYGLGLTTQRFWDISMREFRWLRLRYEEHMRWELVVAAGVRCDIRNAWLQKQDKTPWQISDLVAGVERESTTRHPRTTMTKEQWKSVFRRSYKIKGPNGRVKAGEEGPAVASLVGQPL